MKTGSFALAVAFAFCLTGCDAVSDNSSPSQNESASEATKTESVDNISEENESAQSEQFSLLGVWEDGQGQVSFNGHLAYIGDGAIPYFYTVVEEGANSGTIKFEETGGELQYKFDDSGNLLIGEGDLSAKRISDNPEDCTDRIVKLPIGEKYTGDDMSLSFDSAEWVESFEAPYRKDNNTFSPLDDIEGESYLLVQGQIESKFASSFHLGSEVTAKVLIDGEHFVEAHITNGEVGMIEPLSGENLFIYCSLSKEAQEKIKSAVLYLSFAEASPTGQLFVTPLIG